MAYDTHLASRLRQALHRRPNVKEREQFGGIGFLVQGNMACGVIGKDLLVRVGPEEHERALKDKHARVFSLTGKPSRGWILVRPAGLGTDAALLRWVDLGIRFARSLPAK